MRTLVPVVWSEGMHLAQHHFQLRDRYFQEAASFALSSLYFEPFGLTGLELDPDALLNGTVSLIHARGVMPDGLPFSFPDDPPPEPLEIRERFSPTRESHVVLLAIPPLLAGQPNCVLEPTQPNGDLRYLAETVRVPDETTGQDEKPVTVGRKNFRLVLDSADTEELVTLPLARVIRDRSGNFVFDPEYIPPCLHIGASRRILELLRRLVDVMEAKAASLAAERREAGPGTEFAPDEIAGFWLSHAIHSHLAPLRHRLATRSCHPETLYAELLRLGGALCTFSLQSHPRDLPLYDHRALEECFGSLDRHIRDHLDVLLPRRATRIRLRSTQEFFFRGSVPDERSFRDAHWFLEVRGGRSREAVIADVPRLAKICSAKFIAELVQRAHPGLGLEHLPSPPSGISPRVGAEYFRIQTDGPCWTTMEATGEIGVYAPEALAELELEILIVQEEE